MAEKNNKKKKNTVTATTARKSPTAKATQPSVKKTKGKTATPAKKTDPERAENRKHFSEQFVPYILGGVALFLLVCIILHFIRPNADASDHLMGPVGYAICNFLFGLFGWVAALIPVLLGVLAAFWRKYCANGTLVIKSVLTATTLIFISAVIHVFVCGGSHMTYAIDELYTEGAAMESGGVIGGLLGWLLYTALRLPGTIVLTVVLLPLLIMLILNITPAYAYAKIKKLIGETSREAAERAENQAAYDGTDGTDEPAPKKNRPAMKSATSEELYVPGGRRGRNGDERSTDEPTRTSDRRRRNTVQVDTETGEILKDTVADISPTDTDGTAEDLYLPDRKNGRTPMVDGDVPSPSDDDGRSPWEEIPSAPASAEEGDATAFNENTAEATARATAEELYIPAQRPKGVRGDGSMVSTAYDDEPDDEDKVEPVDTVQITMDDNAGDHIVVNVLPQDHTALTDSADYRVSGLADEEIVLPSGHTAEEDVPAAGKEYQFPPIDLLNRGPDHYEADSAEIIKNTQVLRSVLESFHIRVKDIECSCGPTITRYEVKPDAGIRVRSIANLVDDIAMGLAKPGVRIEAPIPGKSAVGIEVPNASTSAVALRNLLETPEFVNHKSRIAAGLGADVAGRPIIMDINRMPHMLIAGATGSGKSVCINSIIMSIIYKAKPDEVKLILIDPKKVEFAVYRDLPHLYAPIVSDPKKAAGCLNSAVNEMERRFELIEEVGVRNLAGYNEVTANDPERPPLPQMVIIIDELADLMMTASNEVETAICRLAQKARAAGIHLILGTQRPSTDVITGLIKANIPSRIAFTVASQIDSRTIIDTMGAEKLIGRGDMLYAPVGVTKPLRVQGAFVSDGEVERVVTYVKEHNERVPFDENFMRSIEIEAAKCGNGKKGGGDDFADLGGGDGGGEDAMFWDAVETFVDAQRASTSLLQRRLGIGYGKAAKLIDQMEEMGFVGPADGNKPRKMLITKQDLMELRMNGGGSAE